MSNFSAIDHPFCNEKGASLERDILVVFYQYIVFV
jgi:hypothetical protein